MNPLNHDHKAELIIADQAVREEALDPRRSFIVQAPAGSGKTALLMQRFLVLLSLVKAPEECLAITFTRKAAFEMRDRVLMALTRAEDPNPPEEAYAHKTWILAKKVLERSRALDWDLLLNANRLRIQTIDSLCASLTRGMPVLSRLGSTLEVVEEADVLYFSAAKALLGSLEKEHPWSLAVQCLMVHLDNNLPLAQRLLADLLPCRDQWLPYIGCTMSHAEWRAILESGLQTAIKELWHAVMEVLPSAPLMEELRSLALFADRDWASQQDLAYYLGLADWLLTEDGSWRKTVTQKQGFPAPSMAHNKIDKLRYQTQKTAMFEILTRLETYPEFKTRLFALKNAPPAVYTEEQWAVVGSLIQLLPVLSAHLNIVFQEQGQVDFTEVTMAANRALGDFDAPTDLALVLDNKIHHILVDEFQDTSISQFTLLQKLSAGWVEGDGRTLFLVGDPMQSIYRFRQACVGLFLAVKQQGIHHLKLHPLTLRVNFRSDPQIIDWLNTIFSQAFPTEDDISRGAIRFSLSVAHRVAEVASAKGLTVISEEEKTLETQKIIDSIQQAQRVDPTGSIAILVRSRNHLVEILPALREEGIAYQGIDLERLGNRSIIQDLRALTEALLHLGDRVAWLSILRCPWINLSLADILVLAQAAGSQPIWGALNRYATLKGLSLSAGIVLAQCVPILKDALRNRDRVSLRTWVWDTWIALKGHEWMYDEHSVRDVDAFLDTLDKLEYQETIKEPGVLKAALERLYAKAELIVPHAVQIMTIHKSKGLEFDTVILPGLGRQPKVAESPLLLWEEQASRMAEQYLVFAPIKAVGEKSDRIYAYLKQQKQISEHNESLRLLYVASTRARKRLYWIGHKPLSNSLLSWVWGSVSGWGDPSEIQKFDSVS